MVTVKYPECLHPQWFQRGIPSGVVENGKVKVGNDILDFKEGSYPNGTELELEPRRFDIECRTKAEIEQEKKERLEAAERSRRESTEREAQRRIRSRQFNESLNIPVLWSPDIKIVMSGLQEHSMCNGTKKNSVFHVVLRADLKDGKLERKAKQYLCSQPDLKYMRADEFWGDEPPQLEEFQVNCKQCLKIVERWR